MRENSLCSSGSSHVLVSLLHDHILSTVCCSRSSCRHHAESSFTSWLTKLLRCLSLNAFLGLFLLVPSFEGELPLLPVSEDVVLHVAKVRHDDLHALHVHTAAVGQPTLTKTKTIGHWKYAKSYLKKIISIVFSHISYRGKQCIKILSKFCRKNVTQTNPSTIATVFV